MISPQNKVANKKRVAILGATGHIAKNLVVGLYSHFDLYLFARTQEKLEIFLNGNKIANQVTVLNFELFMETKFDIIINCIGIGDPGKLSSNISSIFFITEKYDNLILNYLERNSQSLYINLSSGAAYLNNFNKPATIATQSQISINNISPAECYGISKLNSEAKHRVMSQYNIVDLRVFGFFSRYIEMDSKFFMTEVISCLLKDKILITNSENMIRDYIHPEDLISLIKLIAEKKRVNDAYDAYSLKPTTKLEILENLSDRYGLKYEYSNPEKKSSITGNKPNYFSEYYHAQTLGFLPKYDSITSLITEYEYLKNKIIQ
ncbi:NAD-dependent epimerase/dehydratase family protein [Paenibacillus sp. Soil750]|uniref:NAD-dependent epimerase/dehydratase family protein n=1 Tax=Paenibacillus sp. Soil750 TaxID=1736398 RepID=UPI0006FDF6AF|nr:NAD(P)-dependent oxidoreductase [Paenibacillus sp. Soil750]KRE75415.1 hypothetical protein ASL11_00830 [Paenibacillus sp. Soil750]